jgi:subtilisin family serine protease
VTKTNWRRGCAALLTLTLLTATGWAQLATASAAPLKPGRYIVRMSSDGATERQVDKLESAGTDVDARFSHVVDGFASELSASQLRKLQSDPSVEAVTPDRRISVADARTRDTAAAGAGLTAAATVPWGLDRIDQRATAGNGAYRYDTTGKGVTAFVVDSGVRLTHHDFGGRAVSGFDFVNGGAATDCEGHGTHVAGTIGGSTYGVAKQVKLVSVRVFDCEGNGEISDFIDALDWVVEHKPSGPSVVNFSGAGPTDPTADAAVAATVKAGIPVVVAAGNAEPEGVNACGNSPARAPSAITVGATDSSDRQAYFSDFGTCVDLYAPGQDITSASNSSSNTGSAVLSGTSMAAPHVAGAVARVLQSHPKYTPAQAAAAMINNATAHVLNRGSGSPNRLLFITTSAHSRYNPGTVTTHRRAQPGQARVATPKQGSTRDKRVSVRARWKAPQAGGAVSSYEVKVTDTRTARAKTVKRSGHTRSVEVTGLKRGHHYVVRVRAVSDVGHGSWSKPSKRVTAR